MSFTELSDVKDTLWPEIRNKVADNQYPDETDYLIKDQGKSMAVHLQISTFNLLPDLPQVDLFIEKFWCEINDHKGYVTVQISIPNIEDCEITGQSINIPRIDSKLWDEVDVEDIEKYIVNSWNKNQ